MARSRPFVCAALGLAMIAALATPVSARSAAPTAPSTRPSTRSTTTTAPERTGRSRSSTAGSRSTTRSTTTTTTTISARALARLPAELRDHPDRLRYIATFKSEAARYRIPADLLMALAYTESRWHQGAVSSSGAIGVCQLLPSTARWLATDMIGLPNLSVRDAEDNIRMGAKLLRQLLDSFGTERLALASYFEGHGTIARRGPTRAGRRYAGIVQSRRSWFAKL